MLPAMSWAGYMLLGECCSYRGAQGAHLFLLEEIDILVSIITALGKVCPSPFPLSISDFFENSGSCKTKQRSRFIFVELLLDRPISLILNLRRRFEGMSLIVREGL